MKALSALLEISARDHSHLCPRQILGVRIGLRGICSLQLKPNQNSKRLLVITETDGCFADGLSAATNCTIGHRTLRVEDYGKTAATFVDTHTGSAIRVAPATDLRDKAILFALDEPRHYFAQMTAYQTMPDEEMMVIQEVILRTPIGTIISRPGIRVACEACGEEIMNEREIQVAGLVLCRACIEESYYHLQSPDDFLGNKLHQALAIPTGNKATK
jgi:formylmethanofuran dehydrogenase subunit E